MKDDIRVFLKISDFFLNSLDIPLRDLRKVGAFWENFIFEKIALMTSKSIAWLSELEKNTLNDILLKIN